MTDVLWATLFVAWTWFWVFVLWARNKTIGSPRPDPDRVAEWLHECYGETDTEHMAADFLRFIR